MSVGSNYMYSYITNIQSSLCSYVLIAYHAHVAIWSIVKKCKAINYSSVVSHLPMCTYS